MINYGETRSTVKPEAIKIDEHSVWIHSNITSISELNGEQEFKGYKYNMIQYDKNEYISIMDEQLTKTQFALCELYEELT